MNKSIEVLRNIENGESFICLFSGGKDCAAALALACEKGKPLALVHAVYNGRSCNHEQSLDIIKNQALAMGIHLFFMECEVRTKKYIYELIKTLEFFSRKDVKCMVTGIIDDVYTLNLYSRVCELYSIKLVCPLWKRKDKEILDILRKRNIKAIITRINDARIPKEWLGKQYNENAYDTFRKLGINPLGEYDEFHTTVIDANYFVKRMMIVDIMINKK